MVDIVLYVTLSCPFCVAAKQLLDDKGVDYQQIVISDSAEKRAEMLERSGGITSVPQIFIGDRHVGGCSDLQALEAEGKLDALLVRSENKA